MPFSKTRMYCSEPDKKRSNDIYKDLSMILARILKREKRSKNSSIFRTKLVSDPCSHLNWACRTRSKDSWQALTGIQKPLLARTPKHYSQARTSVEWEANNRGAQTAAELPKPDSQSDSNPEVLLPFLWPTDPLFLHQRQAAYLGYGGTPWSCQPLGHHGWVGETPFKPAMGSWALHRDVW